MNQKTFLKRLSATLFIITLFCGMLFTLPSCEDPVPPAPDCEIYDYGTVTVKNEIGTVAEVDVTWGNISTNDERTISSNTSTTYYEVPAGKIYLWISYRFMNNSGYYTWTPWEYGTEYLSACEEMTYKWYLSGKKSTGTIALDIIVNDKVIETITDFKRSER